MRALSLHNEIWASENYPLRPARTSSVVRDPEPTNVVVIIYWSDRINRVCCCCPICFPESICTEWVRNQFSDARFDCTSTQFFKPSISQKRVYCAHVSSAAKIVIALQCRAPSHAMWPLPAATLTSAKTLPDGPNEASHEHQFFRLFVSSFLHDDFVVVVVFVPSIFAITYILCVRPRTEGESYNLRMSRSFNYLTFRPMPAWVCKSDSKTFADLNVGDFL